MHTNDRTCADNRARAETANRQIERAIALCGGVSHLATRLGVSYQAIRKWQAELTRGRLQGLPAGRAVDIERALGGRIRRQQLRPDLYE